MENPFELILKKLESIEKQIADLQDQQRKKAEDKLMDIDELTKYIHYKKSSIYGLVQDKKIPYFKAAGRLHFRKNDIDKWLNESRRPTTKELEQRANKYFLPR
ncbi:helix-turn-helix domain-containing protein [Salinimicrobium sediminilitoris]|uniref:helix-turn-helix domain-containing protein n=1 Tax=Salinimicrobium sediminilitoris TaxID=2876715 RepID=UPI001E545938|nr:helix-turn-helix domain-containing protein [Salinimicrobium sediminilitoris]MCC8361002.1 helix-turn-helix domain-containing protein [Salinimicrobium sediminilitoris]